MPKRETAPTGNGAESLAKCQGLGTGGVSRINHAADVPAQQRRELPTATATAHEPAGNRTRYLILVSRCPHCDGAHQHYAADFAALLGAVRAGCGRGYRLRFAPLRVRGGHDG